MKTRVNLTIEDDVLKNTKLYAEKQGTSVSELAENYFRSIIDHPKRSNIFDLIDKLPQSNIDTKADLIDLYYKDKAKKYGF
jgi:hypothetical protein